jgi:hypothetical protein
VGEAHSPRQGADGDDCQSCHEEIDAEWLESGHGPNATGRSFLQAWKKEGSSPECPSCHTTGYNLQDGTWEADGLACEVCHAPVPADHPNDIMPADASSAACGTCHVDTYDEWQSSAHGDESLACVNCHNPHTTALKVEGTRALCQTCHNEESYFYSFTTHAEEGLLCTDCHLRVTDAPMGGGHGQRLHTFDVDLESCTQCHGAQMHYPVQNTTIPSETEPTVVTGFAPPSVETGSELATAPRPASSLTYLLTIAVGLGLGIIVAPGLEFLYQRMKRHE